MFPYRRSAHKKRGKQQSGRNRGRDGGQRRIPGSAREMLPMLQPTTKALAQMLAGNTKASGQMNHARAVLEQAERLVAERQAERLNPSDREEFLEQLARLKLTVSDAEMQQEEERQAADEPPPPPKPPIDLDRLREVALALTTPSAEEDKVQPEAWRESDEDAPSHPDRAEPGEAFASTPTVTTVSRRRSRVPATRRSSSERAASSASGNGSGTGGARGQRLRLRESPADAARETDETEGRDAPPTS